MSARVPATLRAGKVNGLQRPAPSGGRPLRLAQRHHSPLLVAGAALYAVCLAFPVVLHQVTVFVLGGAVLGSSILILGLHARWTRARGLAG